MKENEKVIEMDIIKFFTGTGRSVSHFGGMKLFPPVICANGESFSIQASQYHYCEPKETLENPEDYDGFEVYYGGDTENVESALHIYNVGHDEYTYSCVPTEVINVIIGRCGGIDLEAVANALKKEK